MERDKEKQTKLLKRPRPPKKPKPPRTRPKANKVVLRTTSTRERIKAKAETRATKVKRVVEGVTEATTATTGTTATETTGTEEGTTLLW